MIGSSEHLCAWFELLVMVFQIVGIGAFCLERLVPASRWAARGRAGFVVALVGLGVSGALCGQHDSAFGLFAGGTMTVLLIGMIVGNGHADTTPATGPLAGPEPRLAG
jgi:hypothetical protein